MLYKAFTLFRIDPDFAHRLDPETLGELAGKQALRPCGPLELATIGWVPPLGHRARDLVHAANNMTLLALGHEDRLLPATVIRQALDNRIQHLEDSEGRRVGRREKVELRERIVVELTPQAFTRQRHTLGHIDPANNLLVVASASNRDVEAFVSHLRTTLGSLPVTPLDTATAPTQVMTRWLQNDASVPGEILIEGECELEHNGVVRCRDQDLGAQEVQAHLAAGKLVRKLALTWSDRLSFVLGDDLVVRRLRFLELVRDQMQEIETDSPEARADAEFVICSGEIKELVPRLLEFFGNPV